MKLTVVIVSYNVKYYLEQCLMSLEKATEGIDSEVFVVDNHSKDGSAEWITDRFPRVNIIQNNDNLGFARANNQAIKQAKGDYVLLLNPDTVVGEHVIHDAINFMDAHPKAGLAGVRMLREDGLDAMESRRGLPDPLTAFYKFVGLSNRYPHSKRFARYYMSWLPWDEPARMEVASGAFSLLRRQTLDEIGLLDERFFMYGEDIDLSFRVHKAAWECWYLPFKILHYKGESTQKSSYRYVHVFYEAMLIFFRKHYASMSLLLAVPIKIGIGLKAFVALMFMLARKTRESLGFFSPKRKVTSSYLFLCSSENMDACKALARKHGLEAQFRSLEMPLPTVGTPASDRLYAVFDTSVCSFETVFNYFSQNRCPGVRMGFFHPQSRMIVTGNEVMR